MSKFSRPRENKGSSMRRALCPVLFTSGLLAILAVILQPSEQAVRPFSVLLRAVQPLVGKMPGSGLHLRGGSSTVETKQDSKAPEVNPTAAAVESAIETLRNKCMDAGRSNDEATAAVNLIALYVGNAVKNPTESKFHRIRAGNKAFSSKVRGLEGAAEVLEACGFKPAEHAPAEGEAPELFYCIDEQQVGGLAHAQQALQRAMQSAKTVAADTLGQLVTTKAEADNAIEEVWRLSATLAGHEQDVRGVAVTDEGHVVSASRDKTVKVWELRDARAEWSETHHLEGHEYHVASCAAVAGTAQHPELLLSGSYDLTSAGAVSIPPVVNVWEGGKLKTALKGHSGTVSCIAASPEGDKIYSGSWDKSIRVWERGSLSPLHTLQGHGQAVWALLPLPQGKLLSASADRTIRLWDQQECIGSLSGHTDCVRALALLPDGRFVSAGNDNTVKVWSLDLSGNSLEQTCGFCLATLVGHSNFVYALAALPNGDIVSGGEDRTVRVWHDGKCVCTIRHPDTVWSVAALPNGDIATACADGKARIFTQSEERAAAEEAQAAWEALLANCTIASHTMGGLQLDKLPGPEALEAPGSNDGQTRVIRQGSKAFAFAWSAANKKWEPVGEVVDSQGDSKNTMGGGKMTLDGKEYDFVFDIEVEEGRMEKLGINKKDNPYMVASEFIDKHDLNADYLETIVSWLDEEMGKLDPEKQRSESDLSMLDKDPYNEGKVYRAGSAQNLQQQGKQDFYDPLTGKKLGGKAGDDSGDDDDKPLPPRKPTVHVPSSSINGFPGPPKDEALLKKVTELNGNLSAPHAMSEEEMTIFKGLVEGLSQASYSPPPEALALLEDKLMHWPQEAVFPVLDVTRALMCMPPVADKWASTAMAAYSMAYAQEGGVTPEALQQAQSKDMVLKTLLAGSCAGEARPPVGSVLMAMRAAATAGTVPAMRPLLLLHLGTVAAVFGSTGLEGSRVVAQAHATLLLNLAVAARGSRIDSKAVEGLLSQCARLLKRIVDGDTLTMYRVVAAAGTLMDGDVSRASVGAGLGLEGLVRDSVLGADAVRGGMGEAGAPGVQACCFQMLAAFDTVRLLSPGVKAPESDDEFDRLLHLAGPRPVVVDFFAHWCGPCKVIAPVFEELAAQHPHAIFVKVNVDDLRGTAQKYKVEAMPTFKFLERGRAVHSVQGANEAALRQAVAKLAPQQAPQPAK